VLFRDILSFDRVIVSDFSFFPPNEAAAFHDMSLLLWSSTAVISQLMLPKNTAFKENPCHVIIKATVS
jgi:hypothetical protein